MEVLRQDQAESGADGAVMWDPARVRPDFPAIDQEVHAGVSLAYLDNAATSLKPWPVIRAVQQYDAEFPANVHRAIHGIGERATEAFEGARERIARFLGASEPAEVVFTRGATEAVNLVALSWGQRFLKAGDEVLLSLFEHHSNLIPWQMRAKFQELKLEFVGVTPDGSFDLADFERKLTPRTRLVGVTATSNVLGTRPPLEEIVARAHDVGALVLIDAAQAIPHEAIQVARLGCDFLVASAHKLYGPTGVGVLYARRELLEAMPPMHGGGSMVEHVGLQESTWNEVPWKFEAGTPPIAQAIGFGAAVEYLSQFDRESIAAHEAMLTARAWRGLEREGGIRLLGPEPGAHPGRGPIVAFDVEGVHPHDLATLLDRHGVAIRAGHHCAAPIHEHLGLSASARASFALYNNVQEVDRLIEAVRDARRVFRRRASEVRP